VLRRAQENPIPGSRQLLARDPFKVVAVALAKQGSSANAELDRWREGR
jgi:hypothetical protein